MWSKEKQQEWIWNNYKKYFDMFPQLSAAKTDSNEKKTGKDKDRASPGSDKGKDSRGVLKVPERKQGVPENYPLGGSVCGPTSLAMCLEYYGLKKATLDVGVKMGAVNSAKNTFLGTDPFKILAAAKAYGFNGSEYNDSGSVDWLKKMTEKGFPVVFNAVTSEWPGGHYMVCTGVKGNTVYFNDPAIGTERTYSISQVKAIWKMNRAIVIKK